MAERAHGPSPCPYWPYDPWFHPIHLLVLTFMATSTEKSLAIGIDIGIDTYAAKR